MQVQVRAQRLIDFNYALIVIQHQNPIGHRIYYILMGDGHDIKHFIPINGNDKEDGRY
ncbi:hypothetical protein D3C73_1507250 [compost metagenome]